MRNDAPRITSITPNRRHWRPRRSTAASFADVRRYIGQTALQRLRKKLCFDTTKAFGSVVDFLASTVLQDAAALAAIGEDIRSPAGFRRLNGITEKRISQSRHQAAEQLRTARPAIRKAIIAAVFVWLRIQFPILNTTTAIAAAGVLQTLLASRKAD